MEASFKHSPLNIISNKIPSRDASLESRGEKSIQSNHANEAEFGTETWGTTAPVKSAASQHGVGLHKMRQRPLLLGSMCACEGGQTTLFLWGGLLESSANPNWLENKEITRREWEQSCSPLFLVHFSDEVWAKRVLTLLLWPEWSLFLHFFFCHQNQKGVETGFERWPPCCCIKDFVAIKISYLCKAECSHYF